MKICVISTPIFPCPPVGYSGLEMIAWQTARGLAQFGHEVALVALTGSSCPGASIFTIPPGYDEKRAYTHVYGNLLGQFDAIIDHSWQKHSYIAKMHGLKVPVLGVMHAPVDTMYRVLPPQDIYGRLPPVEKPCIVCISNDQGEHFKSLFHLDCRVCRNGIDCDYYQPIPGVERTSRYLFLARFSAIKGSDIGVDVCHRAGVGLDLVGDTTITNEPEYFQQVQARCDGIHIRMVGSANRGECVWWFSRAKALLHPNMRFREPLGLAPLEAQACGLGVIAFDYGAMRETVSHGRTGFLVKSPDEMLSLVMSNAVASLDRDECRSWVRENFSEEQMVRRYAELCEEAVQTGGW